MCIRRCATLLLTPAATSTHAFPTADTGDGAEAEALLSDLPNATVRRGHRLSADVVSDAYGRMPRPCRVVVSGPGGFNSAAREMLAEVMSAEDVGEQVTILSA